MNYSQIVLHSITPIKLSQIVNAYHNVLSAHLVFPLSMRVRDVSCFATKVMKITNFIKLVSCDMYCCYATSPLVQARYGLG